MKNYGCTNNFKKDKKAKELLKKIKLGKITLREAMSTFPEPDTINLMMCKYSVRGDSIKK